MLRRWSGDSIVAIAVEDSGTRGFNWHGCPSVRQMLSTHFTEKSEGQKKYHTSHSE